ncbi:MAG: LptA/OstA family protein [Nitrospiraceae bacterium]
MPAVSDRTISMIEATGRVEIQKEDGRATCQKAIYYEVERKIVLTGQPVAWQKGTRVSVRITMFLDEDRSLLEGDSQVTIEGEGSGKR